MNSWEGRWVILKMSESGQRALAGFFEGDYIEVFVEYVDPLGLFVLQNSTEEQLNSVVLIKWEYFETARMNFIEPTQSESRLIGFKRK